MRVFAEIALTGLVAVLLHPLRSAVTTACLLAVLVPYLAGIGLSKGIQQEAELSIQFGADLYVSGSQFGQQVAVPVQSIPDILAIEGVEDVTPRIVGAVTLGRQRENAVLVGIERQKLPASVSCVQGRLFGEAERMPELVLGSQLARRLRLKVGDRIPPFYRSSQGERVSQVVGIFQADVSLWQANLIFTSLETAAAIFDQPGQATDLLVRCRPGYEARIGERIVRTISFPSGDPQRRIRPHVTSRGQLEALLPEGLLHREGIFNLHFLLAFSVAILVALVTSGFGLSERRREIGILKATGWQTDEVLLRSLVESFLLSLLGAALAVLLAYGWLKWLNGYWVASIFLAGVDAQPDFPVPFRLTPMPVLLSFIISFVIVMSGTLYSSWRAATVSPRTAMR